MAKNRRAAGVLALAAAMLAGCSALSAGSGPLGPTETSGNVCVADVTKPVLTDGWYFLRNSAREPAVIDKVAMLKPRGLRLVTTWAVPVVGRDMYGAEPGYPPGRVLPPGIEWQERRNAVGATIRFDPNRNHVTDFLFVVRLLAKRSWAAGVIIWYHVGAQHYVFTTPWSLTVLKEGACQSV